MQIVKVKRCAVVQDVNGEEIVNVLHIGIDAAAAEAAGGNQVDGVMEGWGSVMQWHTGAQREQVPTVHMTEVWPDEVKDEEMFGISNLKPLAQRPGYSFPEVLAMKVYLRTRNASRNFRGSLYIGPCAYMGIGVLTGTTTRPPWVTDYSLVPWWKLCNDVQNRYAGSSRLVVWSPTLRQFEPVVQVDISGRWHVQRRRGYLPSEDPNSGAFPVAWEAT